MLEFTLKPGELIAIDQPDGTTIRIGAKRDQKEARVGVEAPRHIPIVREEILCGYKGFTPKSKDVR